MSDNKITKQIVFSTWVSLMGLYTLYNSASLTFGNVFFIGIALYNPRTKECQNSFAGIVIFFPCG